MRETVAIVRNKVTSLFFMLLSGRNRLPYFCSAAETLSVWKDITSLLLLTHVVWNNPLAFLTRAKYMWESLTQSEGLWTSDVQWCPIHFKNEWTGSDLQSLNTTSNLSVLFPTKRKQQRLIIKWLLFWFVFAGAFFPKTF